MKQLWILNHYAEEPAGSGGTRHFGLARHLKKLGWQTSIIAASTDHSTGRQRPQSSPSFVPSRIEGVSFLRLRVPGYLGNGGRRVWNMLVYSARALFPSSTRALSKPDVIIGSSVHPFAAVSALLLAWRHKVPFIFEVRDLWPQTLIDMGRLRPNHPLAWCFRIVERWLYRRADRIVTVLPGACDYITPLGVSPDKIVWIPNGVELTDYVEAKPSKSDSAFLLMYFGAHGQANGLHVIIHAMELVGKHPKGANIQLRMVGDGSVKQQLIELAHELGLNNTTFLDPVPKVQIPSLASTADAFIISVLDRPNLYRFGISMNKIFDYFAASRPVVMAGNALNDPISEAGAGYVVKPEDPQALADAIIDLASLSAGERDAMGRAGRAFVEANHAYGQLATKLAQTLDELCPSRS